MTDSLGKYLVGAVADVIALDLSQAATEEYPYAVYELSTEPVMDKESARAFYGDAIIRIYDKDFSVADEKAVAIKAILDATVTSDDFVALLQAEQKNCVDEVYMVELQYRLIQLKDY